MKELEAFVTKGISDKELENFSKVIEKMKSNINNISIERKEEHD